MDTQTFILVGFAFAMGGILKGATGVGAPLVAVPVMATFQDVRFAVAVFVLPNLITNFIQAIAYRKALKNKIFLFTLSASAATGAFAGSLALYQASTSLLELIMAVLVLVYIGFRFYKPDWQLSMQTARQINIPVGILAGFLQGALGISAPATLTFLNAIKFERSEFIVIVSAFFFTMSVIQLPTLTYLGIMKIDHYMLGFLAVIPLVISMPIGAIILRHASQDLFDKLILFILLGVAIKLLWTA